MKQKVKLKEVALYSKGQQINGDELLEEGSYAYLNGGINPSGKWHSYNVEGKTVTVSEGGNSSGYVNYMEQPFWCGAHCYYLYDVIGEMKYIYYALKSQQDRIMKIRSGACMPNIKKDDLGNFEFLFDNDLVVQNQIIRVLDKVSYIINRRQQQLSNLDTLIASRFVELFGGIGDSEKYPFVAIDSFTDVVSGGTPDRKNIKYWQDGNIRWVKTTELQNNIIADTEEKITKFGLDNSSAKIIPKNAILIAMYGQGKTRGMTGYLDVECATNQACACILPSDNVDQKYLWQYMILSYDRLRSLAKGGNQPNLNVGIIKNFQVLMPPLKLQRQFSVFTDQVDKLKFATRKSIDELHILFYSLMQKYFG